MNLGKVPRDDTNLIFGVRKFTRHSEGLLDQRPGRDLRVNGRGRCDLCDDKEVVESVDRRDPENVTIREVNLVRRRPISVQVRIEVQRRGLSR